LYSVTDSKDALLPKVPFSTAPYTIYEQQATLSVMLNSSCYQYVRKAHRIIT